jgi:hypothetical protein
VEKTPVIHIDLNPGDYERGINELSVTIKRMLELCAEKYDVPFAGETLSDLFARLIRRLCDKFQEKVVVIIDEYDKPLLTTIDVPDIHAKIRGALKAFYGVLKSSDAYLQLTLLTGVTKFSQVSVFSDLNNLTDISLNPAYYDLCGITQEELEANFLPEIDGIAQKKGITKGDYLARLKRFYNGYRFSEYTDTVYNPFGLLNHFYNHGKFETYWFATGTPTFLIKLIERQKIDILGLEKRAFTLASLQKFNVDAMDALAVLYQSGYLTIVDYEQKSGQDRPVRGGKICPDTRRIELTEDEASMANFG